MKKKRRRFSAMRFRKNDPGHNVLVAVNRWVRANGGNLVVIGGIEVQDWAEGLGKFKVAIPCLGKKPVKKEGE
jgi:hypothetical protein